MNAYAAIDEHEEELITPQAKRAGQAFAEGAHGTRAARAPERERPQGDSIAELLHKKPHLWMLQNGGLAQLTKSQRAAATRSYQKWPGRNKWNLENYVAYVQERWQERREREASEAYEHVRDEHIAAATHLDAVGRPDDVQTHPAREPEAPERHEAPALDRESQDERRERATAPTHANDEPARSAPPDPPRSRAETLLEASQRLQQLLENARATRLRDTAKYKAQGLPNYPRDSVRRRLIEQAASAPPRRGHEPTHVALRSANLLTRQVARQVVDNPLWIAADYIERNTHLERVDYNLNGDARVREARQHYQRCERAVITAKRGQDSLRSAPAWKRMAATLLHNGERKLHEERMRTSAALVEAKTSLDAIEAEVRSELEVEIADRNGQAIARKEQAVAQREALEECFREALVHRAVTEVSAQADHDLCAAHLKHAQEGARLEYLGHVGPDTAFTVHKFLDPQQKRIYLVDDHAIRDISGDLVLGTCARVELHRDAAGRMEVVLDPRPDTHEHRVTGGDHVTIDRATGPIVPSSRAQERGLA